MIPPRELFGFAATWRAGTRPTVAGHAEVGGFSVRALRWELRDVVIETLDLGGEGHVISYAVEGGGDEQVLCQQGSVFYQAEGTPALSRLTGRLPQGDGVVSPRWHKSDRAWPVEGGVRFEFLGQGVIGPNAVYLFRHPQERRLAVFSDEIDRQDAEEHYTEEARRA